MTSSLGRFRRFCYVSEIAGFAVITIAGDRAATLMALMQQTGQL